MATRNYISKFYSKQEELTTFLAHQVPDGTTCNILSSDLEAGNFDKATFIQPDGLEIDVHYSGPVAEGYVSPFEIQRVYEHAKVYGQQAAEAGFPATTPEEAAYYNEHVNHVETLEDAYAKGYFAGVDSKQSEQVVK